MTRVLVTIRGRLLNLVVHIILYAGGLLAVLPLLWMISTSTKPASEVFSFPIRWIPEQFQFVENLQAVFRTIPFATYYFNSLFVSLTGTALTVFFCTLAGYSFAKFNYPGKNIVFVLVLGTMMIPFQAIMIPLFLTVLRLNWTNSYLGLIIPGAVTSFGIFLTRQYLLAVPSEFIDAARVDGCGEFRIFLTIILPLAKPVLATLSILTFMNNWNDYLWPLVIINSPRYRTISLGLAMFQSEYSTQFNLLMTASLLATIPVLLIFFVFQKQFVQSMMSSGLKG
ncbi:MAG: carbohydrate ABC transporter permease [Firmicutes bacterium]|jgi:multiple sugar transport system permease protein|nr:carbohydrate ABC transporter permease [Bacillota bacterium]